MFLPTRVLPVAAFSLSEWTFLPSRPVSVAPVVLQGPLLLDKSCLSISMRAKGPIEGDHLSQVARARVLSQDTGLLVLKSGQSWANRSTQSPSWAFPCIGVHACTCNSLLCVHRASLRKRKWCWAAHSWPQHTGDKVPVTR